MAFQPWETIHVLIRSEEVVLQSATVTALEVYWERSCIVANIWRQVHKDCITLLDNNMYGFEALRIIPSTQYGTFALALVKDSFLLYHRVWMQLWM